MIGVFGSRAPSAAVRAAAWRCIAALPKRRVLVPSPPGPLSVAATVLRLRPDAIVVSDSGSGVPGLVARAVAACRAVARARGWAVVFPGCPCPDGLMPSPEPRRCFRGLGSGSWAETALLVGLGVHVFVALVPPPPWARACRVRPGALAGVPGVWLLPGARTASLF